MKESTYNMENKFKSEKLEIDTDSPQNNSDTNSDTNLYTLMSNPASSSIVFAVIPFVSFAMIIVSSVKSAPCAFTAETVKNNVKEIIKNP